MKILALDGGGTCGIIMLSFLKELEKKYNKKICEIFNVFAGTSIGAIIICLLVYKQMSAQDILDKLSNTELLHNIMPESNLDKLLDIVQFQPKYQNTKIYDILGDLFADTMLYETDKIVLVTGYDVERNRAVFFKNYNNYPNIKIKDICCVSSAAPAYFPSHFISNGNENNENLWGIDGGIVNNNPADSILIDMIGQYKSESHILLSIGAGYTNKYLNGCETSNWGGIHWILKGNIIRSMIEGNKTSSEYRARYLAKYLNHKYLRIDGLIDDVNASIDNDDVDNLNKLRLLGTKWWATFQDRVENLL